MATEVRRPTATVEIPANGAFEPDSVSVVFPVDNFPFATVSMHEKKDFSAVVQRVESARAAGPSADMQTAIFSPRFLPDANVMLDDGKNNMTFPGYASDPKSRMSPGSVGNTLTIGHESSLLNALRLSSLPGTQRSYRKDLKSVSGKLNTRFKRLTEIIVENYESDPTQTLVGEAGDPQILAQVHDINKRVLPIWYKILENSGQDIGWDDIASLPTDGEHLVQSEIAVNSAIQNILKRGSDGFMGTIRSLTSNFQLLFVPSKTPGEYGKFINWDLLVSGDEDLPALNFTEAEFSGGSPRILPVSNVVVEASVDNSYRDTYIQDVGTLSNIANVSMWPETYNGGTIIPKPAPKWFPQNVSITHNDHDEPSVKHDLDAFEKLLKETAKLNRKVDHKLLGTILKKYAQNYYVYSSLLDATARVNIPMVLSIEVGKVYRLRTEEGDIGKGFLTRVKHTMHTGESNSSTATTSLLFSHVEFNGFELPHKT